MKYQSFFKSQRKALAESVQCNPYDESARMTLDFFSRFMGSESGKKIRIVSNVVLPNWIHNDLLKRAVFEALENGQYQSFSDCLIASAIALNVNEFLRDPDPPSFMPEDLLRSFLLSYVLGYKTGEQIFFKKLLKSGFKEGNSVWSPELSHPDYMAVGLNMIESYQQGNFVIAKPGSRYDPLFDDQCGDSDTINRMCQLHFLLAKGEKATSDLDCPFGNLADSLIPSEVMAYRKFYEEWYGESLPVQGDATCLMEPWLEPRFENRLEDKTCKTIVGALSDRLGKDFLAEALD